MKREVILQKLRAEEADLRSLGLTGLSLFGSTARGDESLASDIDLAALFDQRAQIGIFEFAAISERLRELLEHRVDLVGEPARKLRMQAAIDRDRVRVF